MGGTAPGALSSPSYNGVHVEAKLLALCTSFPPRVNVGKPVLSPQGSSGLRAPQCIRVHSQGTVMRRSWF